MPTTAYGCDQQGVIVKKLFWCFFGGGQKNWYFFWPQQNPSKKVSVAMSSISCFNFRPNQWPQKNHLDGFPNKMPEKQLNNNFVN